MNAVHKQGCQHDVDCYSAGDKVHLVHVICNPRANTDGESSGQTPLVLSPSNTQISRCIHSKHLMPCALVHVFQA